jgi:hypothetical protein
MRKLLLAAALAAFAGPALAQVPIQIPDREHRPPPEAPRERPGRRLFISPSGEPFRGPDGLAAWFAQADADHDGALTAAEFRADALRAFKLYDANGDGTVDGFEIQAYERERVPELGDVMMAGFGDGEGRRGRRRDRPAEETARVFTPGGQQGAARFSLVNEPEPLLAADADIDGKVSLAEWLRATDRRFATLDKTHAGRLTLESLRPSAKKK